jgi:hypothetical protein
LFVPEEYRGTGVGSAMVKNAIHEMIKEDASKPIRLSADPFGKNAMSHQELADWYKKLGFDEETYTEGMSGVPMRYYGKDPGLQNIPATQQAQQMLAKALSVLPTKMGAQINKALGFDLEQVLAKESGAVNSPDLPKTDTVSVDT